MKNSIAALLAIGAVLSISGCASKGVNVSINSFPTGADVIALDSNKVIGRTPNLNGFLSTNQIFGTWEPTSCINKQGFKFIWPSGAETIIDPISFCPDEREKTITAKRPVSAPNLEYDLKFAEMQISEQNIAILKEQQSADDMARFENTMNNFSKRLSDQEQNFQLQQINYNLKKMSQ